MTHGNWALFLSGRKLLLAALKPRFYHGDPMDSSSLSVFMAVTFVSKSLFSSPLTRVV
jgi:hypothetical protein